MERLNAAFEATLKAVENGKEEIFNIAETTRLEFQHLNKELDYLKVEISETIKNVDAQQKKKSSSDRFLWKPASITRDIRKSK